MLMLLCGFISPRLESDRTRKGWQNVFKLEVFRLLTPLTFAQDMQGIAVELEITGA